MKLECGSCGAQYPGDLPKLWGKTAETNGYGPTPKCTALVPSGGPPAPGGEVPREVCGGFLGAIPEDATDAARLITLTLNGETAR